MRHPDRLGENPLLQPARPGRDPQGIPSARALYLFPTKALANDQRAELDETIARLPGEIRIFTYDGDTPQDARQAIRVAGASS